MEDLPRLKTKRRAVLDSEKVIEMMKEAGYRVESMKSSADKKPLGGRENAYDKHVIDFRNKELPLLPDGSGEARLIVGNSADGSSAAYVYLGVWRYESGTGLVVGSDYGRDRINQFGESEEQFVSRAIALTLNIPQLIQQFHEWKEKEISPELRKEFARSVGTLRFDHPEKYASEGLLQKRREADEIESLWGLLTVVQENSVKGGTPGHSLRGNRIHSRPIYAPDIDIQHNEMIWRLAEDYSRLN